MDGVDYLPTGQFPRIDGNPHAHAASRSSSEVVKTPSESGDFIPNAAIHYSFGAVSGKRVLKTNELRPFSYEFSVSPPLIRGSKFQSRHSVSCALPLFVGVGISDSPLNSNGPGTTDRSGSFMKALNLGLPKRLTHTPSEQSLSCGNRGLHHPAATHRARHTRRATGKEISGRARGDTLSVARAICTVVYPAGFGAR